MYLADSELVGRLGELAIQCEHPEVQFDPDSQIQSCSVDLRLSPQYWKTRGGRRRTVDLTGSRLMEVSPRRHWIRHMLAPGETMTLKPGEMILGRTYEELTIPSDCAGALEGRSSFARMGLSVHATGGFINPGWRGHMPLTLVNHGRSTLRLPAYLPICQLMLVPLSATPNRTYGEPSLASKYVDDDGGPSYWWRDKVVQSLLARLGKSDLGRDVQERLLDRIGVPQDDVLERLEQLVNKMPYGALSNADELLEVFVRREDRLRMRDKVIRAVTPTTSLTLIAASIGALLETPYTPLHYVIWVLAALSVPPASLVFFWAPGPYFGRQDLRAIAQARGDQEKLVASPN
ncbi:dCTP deaminase [Micromonospora aurantiaca]|uniref:dCTP deaminase n=1 Tax=Micromonospora aurantiaca (nom. illeg.) TaxID=47850 RepID=UPI0033FD7995